MEEGFDVGRAAAAARKTITTENGPRPLVEHEPLACILADYCAARGISQEQLLLELSADPTHPLSQESFRKLAMVTVNVSALRQALLGAATREDEVA